MNKKNLHFFFYSILILGLILRLLSLDAQGLWTDEAFSLHHAQQDKITTIIGYVGNTEAAPFGYYILLHFWVKAFGTSLFAIRILSVICGTLSIMIFYKIMLKFFSEKHSLIGTLFFSTSMLQVLYSQEARLYALFTLLTLLTTYFVVIFIQAKEKKKRRTNLILYSTFMFLSIYTNYMAFFPIILYSLFVFSKKNKSIRKNWIIAHICLFVLSLPLFPLIFYQFSKIGTGAAQAFIKHGMPEVLAQFGIILFLFPLLILTVLTYLVFFFKSQILSLLKKFNRIKFPEILYVFGVLLWGIIYVYLVFNPLSVYGLALFKVPIVKSYFLIRHSFFIFPLFYVLLVLILKKVKKVSSYKTIIGIILIVNSLALFGYYTQQTKPDWQSAAQFVEENSSKNPIIILLDRGGLSNTVMLNYVMNKEYKVLELTKLARRDQRLILTNKEIKPFINSTDEFWLIISGNRETKDHFFNMLSKEYRLKKAHEFYDVKVYLFEKTT